ncbi:Late embryogenesis abundant protein (LEA) family protein [Forsythia ovata]|uniref:Late embryogenesis abundant protein (LEA) family protein n=1 Tax=Forsythia ovata TaxID=205694 RepID=A0ABD1PYB8_9LAMI
MATLVTAGVFSPRPEKKHEDETVVKEGHRVVVVEFEKDDGNTKVSISPPEEKVHFKEKFSEKLMDDTKEEHEQEGIHHKWSPTELAKEIAKDAASELSSKAKEKAREVKEGAKEEGEKVKRGADNIVDTAKKIKEEAEINGSRKMEATKGKVSEKAKEAKEMVENVSEKVNRVEEEGKRGLKKVLYDVLTNGLWPESMGVLHLLGFATAYGICVWVTFASSYVLYTALARQQFAMVQSKIYPVYFKAMAYSVGMALVGYLMSPGIKSSSRMSGVVMFQGFNLLAPLLMIMVNLLYLEPQASKVMFEIMKKEKEEGRAKDGCTTKPSSTVVDSVADSAIGGTNGGKIPHLRDAAQERLKEGAAARSQMIKLTETLKRLNSYSSFLNVVTLMFLTCHLVYLGHKLNTVC